MHVGIVSDSTPSLSYTAAVLHWAITAPTLSRTDPPFEVTMLAVGDPVTPALYDVLVMIGRLDLSWCQAVRRAGQRQVCIPTFDGFLTVGQVRLAVEAGVEIWVTDPIMAAIFDCHAIPYAPITWSIADPVVRDRAACTPDELCLLLGTAATPSSILSALHAGVPVLTMETALTYGLVADRHNGLVIPESDAPSGDTLAALIELYTLDLDLRERLTCPEPSALIARQHRMRTEVQALLTQIPLPRIIVFRAVTDPPQRRSEEYWADGLRAYGYTVDVATYDTDPPELRILLSMPHEAVLVGKPTVDFLRWLSAQTTAPVVMWHHDMSRRFGGWMANICPYVDLCCLPERGFATDRPQMLLLPGAKVDADRGYGRRPSYTPVPIDSADGVLFLGEWTSEGGRTALIQHLEDHGIAVRCVGTTHRSDVSSTRVMPPVWEAEAAQAHRNARITLSLSRSQDIPCYTSVRLFNAAGSGGCVVGNTYPGAEEAYPDGMVARFETPEAAVQLIQGLLADPARQHRMRIAAENHTWRHHTWTDRVGDLLQALQTLEVTRL